MKNTIFVPLVFVLFFVGGIFGWIASSTKSTAAVLSPIVDTVVFHKPPFEAVGFAPYWLFSKQSSYQGKLTEWAYFGLGINEDGSIQKLVNTTEEEPGWTTMQKESFSSRMSDVRHAGLSTSLVLHLADEDAIATLMGDATGSAKTLISQTLPIVSQYGFFDVNIDIESFRDASPASQLAFSEFFRQVTEGIRSRSKATVTVELTPTALIRPRLTDPAILGRLADRVILMAYDYTYTGSYLTGPVAPIGGAGTDRVQDVVLSLHLAETVVPPEKLLLGIPLYGYEWETLSVIPGAPIIPGTGMTASQRRISTTPATESGTMTGTDTTGKTPYIISPVDTHFLQTYVDDAASVSDKVRLARTSGIRGVAYWALGYESELPDLY